MPSLPKNLKITKKVSKQTIDAYEYLGDNASAGQVSQFGQAVVDEILKRTEDGEDIWHSKFKAYSKSYEASEDFDEFGKTKSQVDMTLTGDMLDSLDFTTRGGTIIVSLSGDTNLLKSYNHNTGDTLPQRRFFGVTDDDLEVIAEDFDTESEDEATNADIDLASVFAAQQQTPEAIFNSLFTDLGFFDGES